MKAPQLQQLVKFVSQLSKRERLVLYAAVAAISISLLDRLVIYPVYAKIKSIHDEIKEKQRALSRDIRILAQKDRISEELKRYATYFALNESEEEGMTSLLKEIEVLANKSSLYVVDMKPMGLKEDKDKRKRYVVTLNCEGQMDQLMEFMYNVENSNLLLTIEKYQLNPKSKDSNIVQGNISIAKVLM